MGKKHQFKFLSQSVLLEESGLPRINALIIMTITVIVIGFIVWSSFVTIEESLSSSGQVTMSDTSEYQITGYMSANDIIKISEGAKVNVSIPGITSRNTLKGDLVSVNNEPRYTQSGDALYEFLVVFESGKYKFKSDDSPILLGMNCRLEIVTGSKTMLQYLLGNLYDTGKSTFDIN